MRLFCKHDYEIVACYKGTQQFLFKCTKCGQYYNYHYGIGCGGKLSKDEVNKSEGRLVWLPENCTDDQFLKIRRDTLDLV